MWSQWQKNPNNTSIQLRSANGTRVQIPLDRIGELPGENDPTFGPLIHDENFFGLNIRTRRWAPPDDTRKSDCSSGTRNQALDLGRNTGSKEFMKTGNEFLILVPERRWVRSPWRMNQPHNRHIVPFARLWKSSGVQPCS